MFFPGDKMRKTKVRATPTTPLNHFPLLKVKKHHGTLPTASSKFILAILLAI
jgi:hypothetical protein